MQTYTQTFAAAATWEMNVPGSYFTTLNCEKTVNVRFYKGGQALDLGEVKGLFAGLEVVLGTAGGPAAFDRVAIDVQAGDTVTIGIGNGQARYNRAATLAQITSNKVPQVGAASVAQKTVTSASGSLLAANPGRQYLLIQNQHATASIYLKFGAAATTAGIKIPPGGNYEPSPAVPTQEIFAIGDTASNTTITVVEG